MCRGAVEVTAPWGGVFFGSDDMFWNQLVPMAAQHCACNNVTSGKLCAMSILPQLKKKETKNRRSSPTLSDFLWLCCLWAHFMARGKGRG